MDRLVLFDVDNTLIKGSTAHKKAFALDFKKVYKINTTIDIINHHGMTDQQIIIEVLKKNGLDDDIIRLNLKKCIRSIIDSFEKIINKDKIIALEGVQKLLKELKKRKVLLGLVTGNLEPIARSKLKKVRLNHYFEIGGFGSDDLNRANLIKIAIKRAKETFGFKFQNNVFVFGDTPKDIKAGKEAGVNTVGVATGIYSIEELENAKADFVLENLKDIDKVNKIIFKAKSNK